jgi:UDPglucose 6-dehydrogenase
MRVCIVGCGHVGLVTGACLAERGHAVLGVDADASRVALLRRGKVPFHEPGLDRLVARHRRSGRLRFSGSIAEGVRFGEVVFICVPTPPRPDGSADLSFVEHVSRSIARALPGYRLVCEKSTVPVNTCDQVRATIAKYARKGADFDVASTPEFLREGRAVEDAMKPDRVVVGVETPRAEKILRELFRPFGAPIVATDIRSAELIKHASNSFLALKISYANALAAVCERVGADVMNVTRGMGLDARIGPQFLSAGIGYGGSCFPKDVRAFEAISRQLGYDFALLREVERLNREARERFVQRVEQQLWIVKDKTVGALGLSFKPDTDDVRESVALAVVRDLAGRGARVRAFDPQAMEAARRELRGVRGVRFCRRAADVFARADCVLILTEWPAFAKLDYARLKSRMAHPTILDGRNLLDPEALRRLGYTYRGVGRG